MTQYLPTYTHTYTTLQKATLVQMGKKRKREHRERAHVHHRRLAAAAAVVCSFTKRLQTQNSQFTLPHRTRFFHAFVGHSFTANRPRESYRARHTTHKHWKNVLRLWKLMAARWRTRFVREECVVTTGTFARAFHHGVHGNFTSVGERTHTR